MNSAALGLERPNNKLPIIVAPERDVPGNIAASNWKHPITKASLYVILSVVSFLFFLFCFLFSITIKATPNTIKAIAIQNGL